VSAGPQPRVILEEPAAGTQRLDFGWDVTVAAAMPAEPRWSSLGLAGLGLAVLVLGFALISTGHFVAAQFAQAAWLGWLTLSVAVAGFGLLFAGIAREIRGYLGLGTVEAARAAHARGDVAALRGALQSWQSRLPDGRARAAGLGEMPIDAACALVEATTLAPIARDAEALGRGAALQAFAMTAISPSPALDVLVFSWRGIRLVRQVAALHGLRPGIAGTLALLRRVAMDAATVAATDVAVDAVLRGVLSSRLAEHVAGETAAGAVAARRMILLARAADEACRVLPRRG
jgi:putative membrane protein